jgi:hypothetical protein
LKPRAVAEYPSSGQAGLTETQGAMKAVGLEVTPAARLALE